MSCFKKTNDGDEELIIFTIAKQFKQLALACKSKKKKKVLIYICTFRKLSKMNTNLLVDVKQEWFFLGLNLHEFPSVHDKKKGKKMHFKTIPGQSFCDIKGSLSLH